MLREILLFISGLLTGVSLMVTDELLALSQVGVRQYPFPLIGTFSIWQSWEIAFSGIVSGVLLGMTILVSYRKS